MDDCMVPSQRVCVPEAKAMAQTGESVVRSNWLAAFPSAACVLVTITVPSRSMHPNFHVSHPSKQAKKAKHPRKPPTPNPNTFKRVQGDASPTSRVDSVEVGIRFHSPDARVVDAIGVHCSLLSQVPQFEVAIYNTA